MSLLETSAAPPGRPTRPTRPRTREDRARQEREMLLRLHRDHDQRAREELVERFLPLACQLARRYAHGGEPVEDLIQVASLGLVKAIDRFDPVRTTAFSSFAVPTILGEIKRHFRDKGWAVKVPRDLQEFAVKVDKDADELSRELGRTPTPAELATRAGSTPEAVLEAREASAARRATSLDRPRSDDEDEGDTWADAIGFVDHGYEVAEASATVDRLLQTTLTEREREVLRLRFEEDLTQSEIGERIGVSQMHVSRLIRRSIQRLRLAAQVE